MSWIAGIESRGNPGSSFRAINPANGETLDPNFSQASTADVSKAAAAAQEAFENFKDSPPAKRSELLQAIALHLDQRRDAVVARCMQETGYPETRVRNEFDRTIHQLRLFGGILLGSDSYSGIIIDQGDAQNVGLTPDVRRRLVPIGPVAVFGASNFPLAYSVAGGDTASALAAACPVIVKGHPLHPGTGELVARSIVDAIRTVNLHPGLFSFLQGDSLELGQALVTQPAVAAVGFTGSRAGGEALMRLATARPHPIPVFAEMGSVNPVFILPHALQSRGKEIAKNLAQSILLGAGQFCTNPGILVLIDSPEAQDFQAALAELISEAPAPSMLSRSLLSNFEKGVERLLRQDGCRLLSSSRAEPTPNSCQTHARLCSVSAKDFCAAQQKDSQAFSEVFGPASVVVLVKDSEEMLKLVQQFVGELSATLQGDRQDYPVAQKLVSRLEPRVGRIVFNGVPTGLRICAAMTHGGPFPASSRPESTAVGPRAMFRWLRPVSYQNFPTELLPPKLRQEI